jgi:prolyl oligopeptidase
LFHEGGHGGAADAKQSAFMTSLAFDFMFNTLSENAKKMD